jgi:uracil-DNA glycosylase
LSPNALTEPIAAVLDRAPASWKQLIDDWRASPAGQQCEQRLRERQAARAVIYPAQVLRALELTPRDTVRVVILGQDPYHGPGQAEGLAFSVPPGVRVPPSLRSIIKELLRDGLGAPTSGHLASWAEQGVLLLNTTLTVEDANPAVHANFGWEALTHKIVKKVASDPGPKVFLLWGAHAQRASEGLSDTLERLVLRANHPSPLSATRGPTPFLGCGHFSAANRFLQVHRRPAILWGGASVL